MKKYLKTIIILAAAVILVVGAIFALKLIKKPEDEPSDFVPSDAITVIKKTPAEIKKITVKNEKGTYTIAKTESGYLLNDDPTLPANNDYLLSAYNVLGNQSASKEVKSDLADLAGYGLAQPRTVTVETADGEIEYYVGDESPLGDGCYCYIKGENRILLLPSTPTFAVNFGKNDFISIDVVKNIYELPEKLTSLKIEGKDRESFEFIRKTDEVFGETGKFSRYSLVSPANADIDDEKVKEKLLGFFETFRPMVAAITNPAAPDFESTGLMNPASKITAVYDGKEYTFSLGGENLDGNRYLYISGTDVIYLAEPDSVKFFDVTSFDIISKTIYIRYLSSFDSISMTADGILKNFDISGEETSLVVKKDGAIVNTDNFAKMCQNALSVLAKGEEKKPENAKLLASLTFHSRAGTTDVLRYYEKDARHAYIELNGLSYYYGERASLDSFIEQLKSNYN